MNEPENQKRPGLVRGYLGRLRHPQLFVVAAAVFVIDLFIPDILPLADEIVLGAVTMLLGALKDRRREARAEPKRVASP